MHLPRWLALLILVAAIVIGAVIFGGTIYLLQNLIIFNGTHSGLLTWQECFYWESRCSTAFATWGLLVFALVSFLAAVIAVFLANKTYAIEIEPILGQDQCVLYDGTAHHADKEVFHVFGKIRRTRPTVFDPLTAHLNFNAQHCAFKNLGRRALPAVKISLTLVYPKEKSPTIQVELGNIISGREVHVAVYTSTAYWKPELEWANATEGEKNKTITFFDTPRPREEIVFRTALTKTARAPAMPPASKRRRPRRKRMSPAPPPK
jgi:hypothetical protein